MATVFYTYLHWYCIEISSCGPLYRPLLSWEIVENKPNLRGAYQRIEKAFAKKASFEEVKKMTYSLANEIGEEHAFTRTVIADVTIVCAEFFQVKETRNGIVMQGMDDGREEEEVGHNVRFEVVTEKNDVEDRKLRKVGNWKIIDIDDMLNVNLPYRPGFKNQLMFPDVTV
jgi:hypothetical protein